MIRIIIYFILFILSSQKFLRKTEENDLSFCFTLNSTKPSTDDDIEIFCSGQKCFGIINSENIRNTFSNITVLCNKKACTIIRNTNDLPEEGECNIRERCKNCFEFTLTCYKGKCIGGPIPNNPEINNNYESNNTESNNNENNNNESNNKESNNNESSNNESNNKESNNNESNNNESNNKESNNNESNNNERNNNESNESNNNQNDNNQNNTIIIINCLDNICNTDQFEDINDNNNNGFHCENNKCSFIIKSENEDNSDDSKWYRNKKFILIFGIILFLIIIFIILDCILICKCGVCNKCGLNLCAIIFCIIFFSPIFFIIILLFICCEKNEDTKISRSNRGNDHRDYRNKRPANNYREVNIFNGEKSKKKGEKGEYISEISERNKFIKSSNISFETNIPIKKNEPNKPKKKIYQIKEIKDEEEKKCVIIQTHTQFCDIERIEDEFYLVNREEIKFSFILCQSLKIKSKNIIIYTFNIAQVNLFKERFKHELSFVKIVLLNEDCTNFENADYIIISYIDSEISEESKNKYYNFKSNLISRNFYTEKFTNNILETYTKLKLYIICNDEYLKKSIENNNINDINNINNINNEEEERDKDKKSKIPTAKRFKEIQAPIINRDIVSNEYNVCFIIDNTGSMGNWIQAIKDICNNLFKEITKKFNKYKFYFGCVLYADHISINTDKNYQINFTQNENEFKSKLEEIKMQNGADVAEDWVSGFQDALEKLSWGNGTKLIFHMADAPHHGKIFNTDKKDDKFLNEEDDINGKNLIKLIKRCSERNIKITGINIDKVGSFKVFKAEYEKANGPNYEIIDVNGEELIKGNDYINKKILDIIEKSLDENKVDESKIIK